MPTDTDEKEFRGTISVAARIIDYLSSGLYKSPAACLKELINNSYDADATQVEVAVKPDADQIVIQDDGSGLNRTEFEKHFRRISESHKRDDGDDTPSGRPKIGKIGIGFIAANELCEVLELFSTKKGSTELLHITIDFNEMRMPAEKRRRKDGELVKADYTGELLQCGASEHYTQIFLKGVRGPAREILAGAMNNSNKEAESLYGLNPDSILERLRDPDLGTWKDFDRYSETLLKVALSVPVSYVRGWMPKRLHKYVARLEREEKKLNFRVVYDGTELRKPIVFRNAQRSFIKSFSFSGEDVSATGYFYAQHGTIKPEELHGLLVRIRHATVGGYDRTFWEFSQSEFSLIQKWISAEIWADDRLEEAMNIDRTTLRDTHPAYVELRGAVHAALREVCSEARSKIYEKGNTKRRGVAARNEIVKVGKIAKEAEKTVGKVAAKRISSTWASSESSDRKSQRTLLKSYSVSELLQVVLDVANSTLQPKVAANFITRLMERLSK